MYIFFLEDKCINAVREQMYGRDTTLVKEFLNDRCEIKLNEFKYYTSKPVLIHAFEEYCKSREIASLDIDDFEAARH